MFKFKKKKNHTFIIYRPHTIFQMHYRYMKYMSDKDTFETNEFSCGMDNESDIAGHERKHSHGPLL